MRWFAIALVLTCAACSRGRYEATPRTQPDDDLLVDTDVAGTPLDTGVVARDRAAARVRANAARFQVAYAQRVACRSVPGSRLRRVLLLDPGVRQDQRSALTPAHHAFLGTG